MIKKVVFSIFALALFTVPAIAQKDNHWDTYVGYQFLRQNIDADRGDFTFNRDSDLNGFNVSTSYFSEDSPVGVTGEFAANFDTKDARNGFYTLMGGLTIQDRKAKFQPFVRGLAGTVVNRADEDARIVPRRSDFAFAAAFGGGADVKISKHVKLRLVQVDYLYSNSFGANQHNLRVGSGIVF